MPQLQQQTATQATTATTTTAMQHQTTGIIYIMNSSCKSERFTLTSHLIYSKWVRGNNKQHLGDEQKSWQKEGTVASSHLQLMIGGAFIRMKYKIQKAVFGNTSNHQYKLPIIPFFFKDRCPDTYHCVQELIQALVSEPNTFPWHRITPVVAGSIIDVNGKILPTRKSLTLWEVAETLWWSLCNVHLSGTEVWSSARTIWLKDNKTQSQSLWKIQQAFNLKFSGQHVYEKSVTQPCPLHL